MRLAAQKTVGPSLHSQERNRPLQADSVHPNTLAEEEPPVGRERTLVVREVPWEATEALQMLYYVQDSLTE